MPRSFRIDPELERRLCQVAEREGVPVSAVVREAIQKHCDAVLGTDTREQLAYFIGVGEGSGEDLARRTGEAFADLLVEKYRRRSAARDPD
jgi:hypothetical protein